MSKFAEQLSAVANKEMDRRNFLKYTGQVVLALIGITGFIRLLAGSSAPESLQSNDRPRSYGGSRYSE